MKGETEVAAAQAAFSLREKWLQDAADVLVTGIGFCLAFGWVWFAGMFAALHDAVPDLLTGTLLSGEGVSVFFAALCGGFLLYAASGRFPLPSGIRAAILSHAAALACVVLAAFIREKSPGDACALLGFAFANGGTWWTARLFGLFPLKAVLALAVAALSSCALSRGGFFTASGIFPLLSGCAVFALGGSLFRQPTDTADIQNFRPAFEPGVPEKAAPAWWGMYLASPFFVFGFVTSVSPASTGGFGTQVTAACATALVAAGLFFVRNKAQAASLLAGGAAFAMAFQCVFFSGMGWGMPVWGGILEGAAIFGIAAAWQAYPREGQRGAFSLAWAGGILALIMLTVNAGGTAGAAFSRVTHSGAIFLAAAGLILCLPALAGRRARFRPHEGRPVPTSVLWPGLTPREQTVAGLVADGCTNQAICEMLHISDNTVRTHLKRLYQKTGVAGRGQLEQLLRAQRDRGAGQGVFPHPS